MKTLIQVKENPHIHFGIPQHPTKCPVARALFDVLNEDIGVGVGTGSVVLNTHKIHGRVDIELPLYVMQAIMAYDRGGSMQPMEFDLDLPEEFLRKVEVPTPRVEDQELVGV